MSTYEADVLLRLAERPRPSRRKVDRTTERWQRIRAAVCEFSAIDDLDSHADNIVRVIEDRPATDPARETVAGPTREGR